MKLRYKNKYFFWGLTAFLVIIASICFYYLLFHGTNFSTGVHTFIGIAMPVIDGLVLAYLLTPIVNGVEEQLFVPAYRKLTRRTSKPEGKLGKLLRGLSIVVTMIVVLFIAYGFFSMIIPQIVRSIQSIVFQLPIYVNNLASWLEKLFSDNPDIENTVMGLLDKYSVELDNFLNTSVLPRMNEFIKTISLSVLGIVHSAWNLLLGLIISIYILMSKETFAGQAKKIAYSLFEVNTANHLIADFRFTHRTFSGFVSGKIVDSIIIGFLCFAGTSIMGTPYAILVSVIVGVTNVIPFFGPYFGAIPSALLILMIDPKQCLYFIIFILVLQQFDGNVIGPKILGDSTGLSSFWVIFSITLFGGMFGVLGMIVGVPIFAVLYAAVKALVNRFLHKKAMPTDTEPYLKVESIIEHETDWEFTYQEEAAGVQAGNASPKPADPTAGKSDETGKTFKSFHTVRWLSRKMTKTEDEPDSGEVQAEQTKTVQSKQAAPDKKTPAADNTNKIFYPKE